MIDFILKQLLPNLILVVSMIYIWYKLSDKKINFKDYKLYLTILCVAMISIFNYSEVSKYIRIIILTIIFMLFYKYLFKAKLNQCIITPIFYQLLIMLSETIYVLILVVVFSYNPQQFVNKTYGFLITDLSVALISIGFVNIKWVKKLYLYIINFTLKIKKLWLIPLCTILIVVANVYAMAAYYKINYKFSLIFSTSITIICSIIIFSSFKTQNKYKEVSDKYNIAINSLRDYESMMNKYRIANHENKNLLSTIRVMVENNEKDIPKYIDSIIEKKYAPDDKLLFETSVIPSGGLRATIYSELVKIKDHNINYNLRIDKRISTVDLIELPADTLIDMCKIICVYIDNAIEEVEKQKDGIIEIEMFCDDDLLNIKVSNSYRKKIDLNKISQVGYTTKGKGHGYGLSLVKQILDSNKSITSQTEINKDIFSQNIKVKIKK